MENMETDNVTFRFRPRKRANSLGSLTDSSILESTRLSLPDAVLDESELNCTSKIKIHDLENQLTAANNEIENLLLENIRIKNELEKCMKLNEMYKKIEYGDVQNSPLLGRKRKRQRDSIERNDTPKKGESINTEEQQLLIYEKQQNKIDELNTQIQQLKQWLEDEKKNNQTVITDKIIKPKPSRKKSAAITKNTSKTRLTTAKKLKIIKKHMNKLQNKWLAAQRENNQLEHKLLQLQAKQNTPCLDNSDPVKKKNEQNQCNEKQNNQELDTKNITAEARKTIIFSDNTGQGLASEIMNTVENNHSILNYCQPGASYDIILNNVERMTQKLRQGDTIVIMISKYQGDFMTNNNRYIKLLKPIMEKENRSFNLLICGLRYNNNNDDSKIYNVNRQIAHLANSIENIRYVDPNMTMHCSNKKIKELMKTSIISFAVTNKFQGSSSLQFIKCQMENDIDLCEKEENFPIITQITKNR